MPKQEVAVSVIGWAESFSLVGGEHTLSFSVTSSVPDLQCDLGRVHPEPWGPGRKHLINGRQYVFKGSKDLGGWEV